MVWLSWPQYTGMQHGGATPAGPAGQVASYHHPHPQQQHHPPQAPSQPGQQQAGGRGTGTPGQVTSAVVTTTAQIQEAHSTTSHLVVGPTVTPAQLQEAEAAMENDKKAIYRHPLFPLMALLFEKCEQATQTPDCPSSDSFDVDIQAFVHHQEQDRKPFFSDDPDLDNLMVKAIQVLRIHLLELEKVNDLCKDFCNRYISCLKGKLQSENLLRSDMPSLDTCGTPPLSSPPPQQNSVAQPATMATLSQGQIVSGGTIYQMVQTAQGLVAQPIQQIQNNSNSNHQVAAGQQQSATVIHGSTPLSQIGVPTAPISSHNSSVSSSPMVLNPADFSDDEDCLGKKKNKRGVLPKQATQVMKSWLFQHIVHPYPTEDEKRQIASQTNLSLLQVNNWFINARRRILQPMLDASNPTEAKVKKTKTANRPVQRFWPDNIADRLSSPNANMSGAGSLTRSDSSPPTGSPPPTPPDEDQHGLPSSGAATPTSQRGDTPNSTPSSTPCPIVTSPDSQAINPIAQQMLSQMQRAPPQLFHNGGRKGEPVDQVAVLASTSDDSDLD